MGARWPLFSAQSSGKTRLHDARWYLYTTGTIVRRHNEPDGSIVQTGNQLHTGDETKMVVEPPPSAFSMAAKKTTTQTVRVNGKRVRLVTKDGKVTIKEAPALEIDLQAAAVRRLKSMPQYAAKAEDVTPGSFTLAADQNGSGVRGRNSAVKLKAAGMAAGEPDLRVYLFGGRLRCLEFKGERGKLEPSQVERFPLLRALGFPIDIVEARSENEAADKVASIVRGWLVGNDNNFGSQIAA